VALSFQLAIEPQELANQLGPCVNLFPETSCASKAEGLLDVDARQIVVEDIKGLSALLEVNAIASSDISYCAPVRYSLLLQVESAYAYLKTVHPRKIVSTQPSEARILRRFDINLCSQADEVRSNQACRELQLSVDQASKDLRMPRLTNAGGAGKTPPH